jgi:hypothetical protein
VGIGHPVDDLGHDETGYRDRADRDILGSCEQLLRKLNTVKYADRNLTYTVDGDADEGRVQAILRGERCNLGDAQDE